MRIASSFAPRIVFVCQSLYKRLHYVRIKSRSRTIVSNRTKITATLFIMQMYVASTGSQVHIVTLRLSECIADVTDWCDSRRLQLNSSTKTELMWFGTSSSLRGLSLFDKSLAVGDVNQQPVESVRNLGVYFDSGLSIKVHVTSKTAQVCFSSYEPDSSFTRPRHHIQSSRCTRLQTA